MNIEKRKIKFLKKLKKLQGKKPKTFNQAIRLATKHISLVIEYKKLDMQPRPRFKPGGTIGNPPCPRPKSSFPPFEEIVNNDSLTPKWPKNMPPSFGGYELLTGKTIIGDNGKDLTNVSTYTFSPNIDKEGFLKTDDEFKKQLILDAKAYDARNMENAYQY